MLSWFGKSSDFHAVMHMCECYVKFSSTLICSPRTTSWPACLSPSTCYPAALWLSMWARGLYLLWTASSVLSQLRLCVTAAVIVFETSVPHGREEEGGEERRRGWAYALVIGAYDSTDCMCGSVINSRSRERERERQDWGDREPPAAPGDTQTDRQTCWNSAPPLAQGV